MIYPSDLRSAFFFFFLTMQLASNYFHTRLLQRWNLWAQDVRKFPSFISTTTVHLNDRLILVCVCDNAWRICRWVFHEKKCAYREVKRSDEFETQTSSYFCERLTFTIRKSIIVARWESCVSLSIYSLTYKESSGLKMVSFPKKSVCKG